MTKPIGKRKIIKITRIYIRNGVFLEIHLWRHPVIGKDLWQNSILILQRNIKQKKGMYHQHGTSSRRDKHLNPLKNSSERYKQPFFITLNFVFSKIKKLEYLTTIVIVSNDTFMAGTFWDLSKQKQKQPVAINLETWLFQKYNILFGKLFKNSTDIGKEFSISAIFSSIVL